MLQGYCWWKRLVEVMTGGGGGIGGERPREMAATTANALERPPCPVSFPSVDSVSVRAPPSVEIAEKPLNSEEIAPLELPMESSSSSLDFFSQARKALCLRSPFDVDDAPSHPPSTSASASVPATTFLPSALAHLLNKNTDSHRKRHKRSHSAGEQKKARPEKSRGTTIWTETEEYFRELTVEDVDRLYQGSCLAFAGSDKYLATPEFVTAGTVCKLGSTENLCNVEVVNEENNGVRLDDKDCSVREEGSERNGGERTVNDEKDCQSMDVDIVGEGNEDLQTETVQAEEGAKLEKGVKGGMALDSYEWLLGSRRKIYLTSERPSKKRKLLGGDAGLEKLLITHPVDGSTSLCHYCSTGDMGDQLNRLIVCSSCSVAVHQRCYGVQNDVEGTWLCSWCRQRKYGQSGERPCLLCSKPGGALKPAQKRDNQGPVSVFAHLFCCQWVPEVYVENIRSMEPIMNIDGINETRWKLICCLCKVKSGVCVRCSNGACRTAFHPLCAREARHRMEIWGRLGCDEVELRAFCAKHSEPEIVTGGQCTGDASLPIDTEAMVQPSLMVGDKIQKNINGRNGNQVVVNDQRNDLGTDEMDDQILQVDGFQDNLSNSKTRSDVVNVQPHVRNGTVETDASEDVKPPVSLNCNLVMKKLIDQGEAGLKDLAEEFGVSLDSLSPLLTKAPPEFHDIAARSLQRTAAEPSEAVALNISESSRNGGSIAEQNDDALADVEEAKVSSPPNHLPALEKADSSCPLPFVQHKLIAVDNGFEYESSREREFSQLGASSSSGICCNGHSQHSQQSAAADWIPKFNEVNFEQLVKARNMGVLQLSPSDELEGELKYYQHKLMSNAVRRKCFMDELISKVAKNLQWEIDSARKQKWDAVLLSQYLYELREAKKQGRKERRHKEAQATLAAATAAAAASSRISSLRKDTIEESGHLEELPKGGLPNGRPGVHSQQNPRVKETSSRTAAARISSEKNSELFPSGSNFSVEHPRTCEICGRCETILNPILVCSSCKVAVHLDCYRGVKSSTGPWFCELCDDILSSGGSGVPSTITSDKPFMISECGLCGGTAGAFRKSTNGQWVHAFCAEWLLESTFRRGQVNPVDGMELLSMGVDVCIICSRKQGVCVKCSYGNCQSTFHASCARSAGFYMNVRSNGGKLHHKAYCGKHSLEQKAKAEVQKHGIEEFKSLKQVRVELERLRLLCERIIKREKLKRELVLCSHDILASNRDAAFLSALSRHTLYHPDLSSESGTTSTRCYTDGRSGSDTIQRSDDVTVDSTLAGKRRIKIPMSMDNEQKTDDSSVSQQFITQKPHERMLFSGKQIPHRPAVASRNHSDDLEKRSRFRKHPETFEKEMVMTSDQASLKNQRLPKGFVYVPVRCVPKEKENLRDECSQEPLEHETLPDG
ncbi:OLC1v1015446C2 [Oldenlandia corymbosa var. corymbosa]|uniref:OLC1v1015446C2 n=1 Tax=Oldenlandia corymbosa var. corymbosa TaxID=529605 RepID=A0AAV1E3R6_OLDCO|nr:OLC1v1015446C2 [Oldenlandia corymbosa var. corymbosa]